MTFMIHPEHGANNVSESEVAEQEKNGWTVSTPEEWMALAKPEKQDKPDDEPVKRMGRPPKAK